MTAENRISLSRHESKLTKSVKMYLRDIKGVIGLFILLVFIVMAIFCSNDCSIFSGYNDRRYSSITLVKSSIWNRSFRKRSFFQGNFWYKNISVGWFCCSRVISRNWSFLSDLFRDITVVLQMIL